MNNADLIAVFGLPPEKAIEYFRQKGYAITWDWRELWQESQAKAFTVAKVMRSDILNDIRSAVDDALLNGTTFHIFQKNLTPILQAKGWWGETEHVNTLTGESSVVQLGSLRRLKTIYQTNLQTAYMAGRYNQMMESVDTHPYWMYVAVLDGRTRKAHRAINGRIFRYDDPIWDAIFPPNGFKCRCRVVMLTDNQVKAMGVKVSSSEGKRVDHEITLSDGSKVMVQGLRIRIDGKDELFTPDAGWSYNPGKAVFGNDVEVMRKISAVKDRAVRVQAVQAINNSALRHEVFGHWVDSALTKRAAGHDVQVVGFVAEAIAEFARLHNGGVDSARVLSIPEKRLLHADSVKHQDGGITLTASEYKMLPSIVANPSAVYWDTQEKSIVYAYQTDDGRMIYVPARLDYNVKKLGNMDVLINAYKIEASRLDSTRYIKMVAQ